MVRTKLILDRGSRCGYSEVPVGKCSSTAESIALDFRRSEGVGSESYRGSMFG